MRFTVSGHSYEFVDPSPESLMGDELLLIEEHAGGGDLEAWGKRLEAQKFGVRDVLLLTYLAARRQGETRPWDEFIRTIAPLTFRVVADEPIAPPPPASNGAGVGAPLAAPESVQEPVTA